MHRFISRPQFQAALSGPTIARTSHFALHTIGLNAVAPDPTLPAPPPLFPLPGVWIGAMVPKRWARRAVTRNTIKRQIYNVSALFETSLPHGAHVVRLRSGFDRSQFPSATSDALRAAVRAELTQLFQQAASRAARA